MLTQGIADIGVDAGVIVSFFSHSPFARSFVPMFKEMAAQDCAMGLAIGIDRKSNHQSLNGNKKERHVTVHCAQINLS